MTAAYYNEIDPYAAAWLRNLIEAGHIAPGMVDERSIEDVSPDDLRGFTQCHFFAGIGVWSYALRRAGWDDDRPVWTGSCPCQPFSAAGKGAGFADERHLWPAFHHLISECSPAIVFGEQVASKDANPWIDLVQTDLEAVGYRVGAVPFPSAGVGAPHIRDRNYWLADSNSGQRDGITVIRGTECNGEDAGRAQGCGESKSRGDDGRLAEAPRCGGREERFRSADRMADTRSAGLEKRVGDTGIRCEAERTHSGQAAVVSGDVCGVADADLPVAQQLAGTGTRSNEAQGPGSCDQPYGRCELYRVEPAGPTNGFWRDADWLFCRDGKWRPVEPGTFPLAASAPSRVGRLRAYGNAINAEAARVFIESVMESI